jgi:hypothetical protein
MILPIQTKPSGGLLVRETDTDAVQEPSIIRRFLSQIGSRKIHRRFSEAVSPTIRKRLHRIHVAAAPWAAPADYEVVRCREADRQYALRYSTTFARQPQLVIFDFWNAVFHFAPCNLRF